MAERFWQKVAKSDGCWEWVAVKGRNGYGKICEGGYCGRMLSAHRVSWELHYGPVPDGLFVLHECDNKGCVNPAHLFVGTHVDNMKDMCRKGRHRSQRAQTPHN